ncbi:hypothetical protein [Intestinibacter bartlettii]|uniref:Uncharacterized protein n=1 Tax=Intestinibacter bartlettii TaxID=261299 RepID=A0ABS6DXI9_9FIRM|nr:hypothetical protein [Intestinibacter bartlettii]MBU5336566.1 hypothetical protein [Intestinibacter bartlettii]
MNKLIENAYKIADKYGLNKKSKLEGLDNNISNYKIKITKNTLLYKEKM